MLTALPHTHSSAHLLISSLAPPGQAGSCAAQILLHTKERERLEDLPLPPPPLNAIRAGRQGKQSALIALSLWHHTTHNARG